MLCTRRKKYKCPVLSQSVGQISGPSTCIASMYSLLDEIYEICIYLECKLVRINKCLALGFGPGRLGLAMLAQL